MDFKNALKIANGRFRFEFFRLIKISILVKKKSEMELTSLLKNWETKGKTEL